MTEPTDAEHGERSIAVTLGEVLAGLQGMAEIPGMPELAEMPPAGFTFQIPPCQRPYCWKLSDIEHVLADVADMRSSESTTPWYFGPICFRRDQNVMQIYDGQQRLTSMLLVVSVLAERLQADGANLGLSEMPLSPPSVAEVPTQARLFPRLRKLLRRLTRQARSVP